MYGTIGLESIECKQINITNHHKGKITINNLNQKINKLLPPPDGYVKMINVNNNSSGNINIGNIKIQSTNITNAKIKLLGLGTVLLQSGTIKNLITKQNDSQLIIEPTFKIYNRMIK